MKKYGRDRVREEKVTGKGGGGIWIIPCAYHASCATKDSPFQRHTERNPKL